MYTKDELQNLNEDEKKKQKSSLNMQIVILESDQKKFLAQKNALDAETKRLKIDEQRIRLAIEEKKGLLAKIDFEIAQIEAEIKRIKGRLNLL